MTTYASLVFFAAIGAGLCFGCSTSDGGAADDAGAAAASWVQLIEADWTLPAGDEGYTCARATVPEEMFVHAFRPIAPLGTHHTVFSLEDAAGSDAPDEVFPCSAAVNGPQMLFGSGVGTDALEFPEGVAVKLEKGSKVLLNLHLFNVSKKPLSGTSGVEIVRMDPAAVEHEAEIILAGKISGLTVEPGASTQTGSCAMSHDVTVFAVFPHMHQMGVYLKATAEPATGAARVLTDGPYSFDAQQYYPIEPALELAAGDQVKVECQYQNPGADTVRFGDSSLAEMCFAGLYRYPKGSSGFLCSSGSDGGPPLLEGAPCVAKGAKGNAEGVGKYCTAAGGECTGTASICLKDYTDGDFGDFCTKTCTSDASCGTGATCVGTSIKACIPDGCEIAVVDAGSL